MNRYGVSGQIPIGPRPTVVLLSSIHWHFTWQHHQTLATALLERGYEVIWVEPLPKRWPRIRDWRRVLGRLRGNLQRAGGVAQQIPSGLIMVNARLIPERGPISSWINRRLLLPALERSVRRNVNRPLILLHYLPLSTAMELHRRLAPDFSAYGRFSEWEEDPTVSRRALREDELCRTVDVILAESAQRAERVHASGTPSILVPPSVDFPLFRQAEKGTGGVGEPLCAYFGLISEHLDLQLIHEISQRYRVRLIGPRRGDTSVLEGGNIELLDPVPRRQLPKLLQPADVLLLPYRSSSFHDGVIPTKTFECLATGKPVVATGLPALKSYEPLIRSCDRPDVVGAIDRAMEEFPELRARRIELAREHSLEAWFDHIEAAWTGRVSLAGRDNSSTPPEESAMMRTALL